MNETLAAIAQRAPVSCAPQTPIRVVLQSMREAAIGSMIVVDADDAPLGIFTLHDLLERVALAGCDLSAPIAQVMSAHPVTLPAQATGYEAALAMMRQGIRHIVVTARGKLAGVVSQKDLFSLQRVDLARLSQAIAGAGTVDSLAEFGADIRQLARNMLAQGVAAEQLTRFIASLNDLLTQRIIDLESAQAGLAGVPFCWMALGSEGRFEQTFSTDQDNGIVFASAADAEAVRQTLLPFAGRVNAALARCGFPLCKGGIMASNPRWCLSLGEWKQRFGEWIDAGDPEALLHGSVFFDFRALHGAPELAIGLRQWLLARTVNSPRFLHQMAENALRIRPPAGVLHDFILPRKRSGAVDLKLYGATPFVDAARIFSLAAGVAETNTVQRLRQTAPVLGLPDAEVEAWIKAFLFIQSLRLDHQRKGARIANRPPGPGAPESDTALDHETANIIDPAALDEMSGRILKEAFRQARKLQLRIALDYRA